MYGQKEKVHYYPVTILHLEVLEDIFRRSGDTTRTLAFIQSAI